MRGKTSSVFWGKRRPLPAILSSGPGAWAGERRQGNQLRAKHPLSSIAHRSMTKTLDSPTLAQLLRAQRDVILSRTVRRTCEVRSAATTRKDPSRSCVSWVAASLSDLIRSLEEGSPQPLMDRAETLSR